MDDRQIAMELQQEALDRTELANAEWVRDATERLRMLAERVKMLTTDDLWIHLDPPPEPRAMGAVMRRAKGLGIVEPTMVTVRSKRPACHGRPVRVWKSKVYRP